MCLLLRYTREAPLLLKDSMLPSMHIPSCRLEENKQLALCLQFDLCFSRHTWLSALPTQDFQLPRGETPSRKSTHKISDPWTENIFHSWPYYKLKEPQAGIKKYLQENRTTDSHVLLCFQESESTPFLLRDFTESQHNSGGHLVQLPAQSRSWLPRYWAITARDWEL